MNIDYYIQNSNNENKGVWLTLPTCNSKIEKILNNICANNKDTYKITKIKSDYNFFVPENADIFKQNEMLSKINSMATTEEIIGIAEYLNGLLYHFVDVTLDMILLEVEDKSYVFLPNMTYSDLITEYELNDGDEDDEWNWRDFWEFGAYMVSTGIIQWYDENDKNLDKTSN